MYSVQHQLAGWDASSLTQTLGLSTIDDRDRQKHCFACSFISSEVYAHVIQDWYRSGLRRSRDLQLHVHSHDYTSTVTVQRILWYMDTLCMTILLYMYIYSLCSSFLCIQLLYTQITTAWSTQFISSHSVLLSFIFSSFHSSQIIHIINYVFIHVTKALNRYIHINDWPMRHGRH